MHPIMRFKDIAGIIEANKSLIGKTFKGATIDELVCIPVGHEEQYRRLYIETPNAEQAFAMLITSLGILPTDIEYQVYAVFDKFRIVTEGILTYANINDIKL